MVKGLQRFVDHFKGFADSYVLIGGAACDIWLTDRGLTFRATKDIDLVLVVEALRPAFFTCFWEFIRGGRYKSHQQSAVRPVFYRFQDPMTAEYPYMIELLSRTGLELPADARITPIPAGDDISSLSAILLDDTYYRFVVQSRTMVNGVPILPAQCLIPLKARAWLDLTVRKERGDVTIKSDDIKKHRYDVFRLYLSIAPADRFELPPSILADLGSFLDRLPRDSADWSSIREAVGRSALPETATVLTQIRAIFGLPGKG
jgi:hypothetical protein